MSNASPIEPNSAANQQHPEGGQDFLHLEGELDHGRASRPGSADPRGSEGAGREPFTQGSWLLDGDGPGLEPRQSHLEEAAACAPGGGPEIGEGTPPGPLQPLALETSFCEAEPASRAASRVARRSLVVVGGVLVAVAGIQLYFQGGSTSTPVDPPKAVEVERTVLSGSILSGPGPARVAEERVTRDRVEPSDQPRVYPAQAGEPAVRDEEAGAEETAEPFDLDGPGAAFLRAGLGLLLAACLEGEVATPLEEPKAAEPRPASPLPAPSKPLPGETGVQLQGPSPLEALAGRGLGQSWMLLHPALTPRREGPAPIWVRALDPLPEGMESAAQCPGDWIVAEAVEKPAVPAAPGPAPERPDRLQAEEEQEARGGGHATSVPAFGAAPGFTVEVCLNPPIWPDTMTGPSGPRGWTSSSAYRALLDRPAVALPDYARAPSVAQACGGGCKVWCDLYAGGAWRLGEPAGALSPAAGDLDWMGRWNLGEQAGAPIFGTGDLDGTGMWNLGGSDPISSAWEGRPSRDELPCGALEAAERSGGQGSSLSRLPVTDRVVLEPVHPSGDVDVLAPPPTDASPAPDPLERHASHPLSVIMGGGSYLLGAAVGYLTAGELPGEALQPSKGAPRARALARAPLLGRWDETEIPDGKLIAGPRRVLTPNVGEVLASLEGGGKLTGTLHAVGHGRVWLDTRTGRMSLEARRVTSLKYVRRDALSSERVCVTTLGGVFVGTLLARDGERITLRTNEGLTLTLAGADVRREIDQRPSVGLRRRAE